MLDKEEQQILMVKMLEPKKEKIKIIKIDTK